MEARRGRSVRRRAAAAGRPRRPRDHVPRLPRLARHVCLASTGGRPGVGRADRSAPLPAGAQRRHVDHQREPRRPGRRGGVTDRSFDFGRSVLGGPRGPSGRSGGLVAGPEKGAIRLGNLPGSHETSTTARPALESAEEGRSRPVRRNARAPTALALTAATGQSPVLISPPTRRARPVRGRGRTRDH